MPPGPLALSLLVLSWPWRGIVKHGQTVCIHNMTYDHLQDRSRDTVVYLVMKICNHAYHI